MAEVRGGRLSISPLELDSGQVGAIRERIPEAMYETSKSTLSATRAGRARMRGSAAVLALVESLGTTETALVESR